ncbi:hypothetical protein RFI_38234, partial [Reticulomyxa filosa]
TPGEPNPLQFSTMDLCSSTLEVQNVSDHAIILKGFYLTNLDKSKKFLLPPGRVLKPSFVIFYFYFCFMFFFFFIIVSCMIMAVDVDVQLNYAGERVKIIVGNDSNLRVAEGDLWWNESVWSGTKDEIARLYDSSNQEISRVEISPEMLHEKVRSCKNCLIIMCLIFFFV